MGKHSPVIHKLRKAMEFYQELGFEYLPVKGLDIRKSLSGTVDGHHPETPADDTSGPAAERGDRGGALESLRNEIGDCIRCKLSTGRKNIVFGEGNAGAALMFIGEGPGRDEDIQARPFVGDAGKLLTNLIVKLGLKREDVYIANIVKCRPPGNRNPQPDEISACMPFLERQIEIIKPGVIVCLGNVAAKAILGSSVPISRLRGTFYDYHDIPVMPTFHPAYLLRNSKAKWLTWEDMQKVLEQLKS